MDLFLNPEQRSRQSLTRAGCATEHSLRHFNPTTAVARTRRSTYS